MGSAAVAPDRRAALWRELLLAEYNCCYWSLLSQRDTKIDSYIRGALALSSTGVTGWTFWAHVPTALSFISMASSVVAWLHVTVFTSERLKKIAGLVGTWKQISIEYALLWETDQDLAGPETWKRFEAARKLEATTDETGLPQIDKLKEKAFQQMMKNRNLS